VYLTALFYGIYAFLNSADIKTEYIIFRFGCVTDDLKFISVKYFDVIAATKGKNFSKIK
jgi:hypothetical protein